MLRRLTAVAMIWLSLLGAALPAFACSLAASTGDCCDQQGTPCTGGQGYVQSLRSAAASCCVTEDLGLSNVAFDAGRTPYQRGFDSCDPNPLALVAWSASWLTPVPRAPPALSQVRPPPSTAALTYLHTARLRL